MSDANLELMAHLMRRAGFGASRDELERRVAAGYGETVDELLNPERQEPVDYWEFLRYYPTWWKPGSMGLGHAGWVWRMINTQTPLQEKLCLFYHQLFATGVAKVEHAARERTPAPERVDDPLPVTVGGLRYLSLRQVALQRPF